MSYLVLNKQIFQNFLIVSLEESDITHLQYLFITLQKRIHYFNCLQLKSVLK